MTPKVAEKAYTIAEVAELKSVSVGFVRAAIHATGEDPAHPPLEAKRPGGKTYRISASAIETWWAAQPDG
jgi:excisionase family DNA binding protein